MAQTLTLKSEKSPGIVYLAILYIIAWCVSPPLSIGWIYRIVAIAAVGILIFQSGTGNNEALKRRLILTLFLIGYMALVCFITDDLFNRQINTYSILLVSVGFAMWNHRFGNDPRQLKRLILFALALFCIWNTTTIIAIRVIPTIMRLLTGSGGLQNASGYILSGVGGFGYLYSAILALPFGIAWLTRKKEKLLCRIILIYFVVSTYVLAYMSQFFTALIVSLLVIPIMWLARRYRKGMNPIVLILIGIVVFVFMSNLDVILDFFIDTIDLHAVHRKLLAMKDSLINGESFSNTELGERYERYTRDLDLILHNPIFGSLTFYAVGKHSCFLDFAAQYGLILTAIFAKLLLQSCFDWIKYRMTMAYTILWITLILAFMNPLPIQLGVPLCIMLPAYCKIKWLESQ